MSYRVHRDRKLDLPLVLTILAPGYQPRGRGIHAQVRAGGIKITYAHDDEERLRYAAELAGLTVSDFVRQAAVNTANTVIQLYNERFPNEDADAIDATD